MTIDQIIYVIQWSILLIVTPLILGYLVRKQLYGDKGIHKCYNCLEIKICKDLSTNPEIASCWICKRCEQ